MSSLIKECKNQEYSKSNVQSLIIFEDSLEENSSVSSVISIDSSLKSRDESVNTSNEAALCQYFNKHKVIRMFVVERPETASQFYLASGLREKYHFSAPTASIPVLHNIITESNNKTLELVFIPRTCKCYDSNSILVLNDINIDTSSNGMDIAKIHEVLVKDGIKSNTKRSMNSISIGLQTMYSHQQHIARYSMLPHSRPHVPTVKKHHVCLREALLVGYKSILSLLSKNRFCDRFDIPFSINNNNEHYSKTYISERHNLRNELLQQLIDDDLEKDRYEICPDHMFEACTIQPTGGYLSFHQDVQNCPSMDYTFALHIPFRDKCMSLLYYSRKSVGDHAIRMSNIQHFHDDVSACYLTKLCMKSMMATNTVFDYQSIFENEKSFEEIGKELENTNGCSCQDLVSFCGVRCFKSGAAFDKMGYYSIVLNVFLSLFYNDILENMDDSIGLCMYFGLLCNGTSILCAVWKEIKDHLQFSKEFCSSKPGDGTRMFRLLVLLDKQHRRDNNNKLIGNCKLNRYQFANYSEPIIEKSKSIHRKIKVFIVSFHKKAKATRSLKECHLLHGQLYNSMKDIKGIGPLNFNQLWHSLCLCGLLPHNYIQSSAVGLGTGPAKLIQTYDKGCTSAKKLLLKLRSVRSTISSLGMNKVSEFFLENMMCELWRLAKKLKLLSNTNMSVEQRKEMFSSDEFQEHVLTATVSKYPDIYYVNPFTDIYQNLFRVIGSDLHMRPSNVAQNNGSSVTVICTINHHCISDGNTEVSWEGQLIRSNQIIPSSLFT